MCQLTQQDVLDFEQSQIALKNAKALELKMRKKIINHFRYGKNVEGVQHKSIDGLDIDILITLKLSCKLDKDGAETIYTDLNESEKECIDYVPTLNLKKYKELSENGSLGKLVNIVTEKPGLASVALKYEE